MPPTERSRPTSTRSARSPNAGIVWEYAARCRRRRSSIEIARSDASASDCAHMRFFSVTVAGPCERSSIISASASRVFSSVFSNATPIR